MRSREEGYALRNKTEPWQHDLVFPETWKANVKAAAVRRGKRDGKGICRKNGYLAFTRGPNKGRKVHTVRMEEIIGRRLRKGEHVHHKDGDRLNNSDDNLQLMTVSEHARLHALERGLGTIIGGRRKKGIEK